MTKDHLQNFRDYQKNLQAIIDSSNKTLASLRRISATLDRLNGMNLEEKMNEREPLTLITVVGQFQHYYSPELEANPNLQVEFNTRYSMRSCLTTGIEPNTAKRCTCGKYLLIRGPEDHSLSPLEQQLLRNQALEQ